MMHRGDQIEVLPDPNRPPIAIDEFYATLVNFRLVVPVPGLLVNDLDPDGDVIRVISAGPVNNGLFTQFVTNGAFTWIPDPGFVGTELIPYRIDDLMGLVSEGVLSIRVIDPFGPAPDDMDSDAQSTQAVTVANTATNWQTFTLSLRAADLVADGQNNLPVSAIISAVHQIGLRHDPSGSGPGNPSPVTNPTSVWFDDLALLSEP